MCNPSHKPGRRTLIAGVLLALLSAGAFVGAQRLLERERDAIGRSVAVRGYVELQMRVEGGRLVPLSSHEFGRIDAVYRASIQRAAVGPRPATRGVAYFGWLWGTLPIDDVARGEQSLAVHTPPDSLPDDFETQVSAQVGRAFDGAFPGAFSAWSGAFDETTERALWLELGMPARVGEGRYSAVFDVDGLGYTTPRWVLPTVSVLSATGFAFGAAALVCLTRWAVHGWRRRGWRKSPTACAACGYEMEGLSVCPECGANGPSN